MKRFLAMIVAMCSIIVAMAQHPMATLSHDGELTQFTGVYALQNAAYAAVDGDVIYLSEGEFLSSSNEIVIDHRVSIIGCGYNSHILPGVAIGARDEYVWDGKDTPVLDGLRLNAFWFFHSSESKQRLKRSSIRNCWIGNFGDASYAGEEIYIDQCIIDNFRMSDGGGTVYLNNCKIGHAEDNFFHAIATNCNIKGPDLPRIANSCIFESVREDLNFYTGGIHKVYNSLFQNEDVLNYDNVSFHNCYFENPANGLLDENLDATIDLQAKGYLGQDGTIIGAYGGENPFSEYPSVPTIDSEKSSVEFDPASNKLNVTITVASN